MRSVSGSLAKVWRDLDEPRLVDVLQLAVGLALLAGAAAWFLG